ncbi:MAG TPA: response regulator [Longimicrobium sp.]|nr:response regulator [Longimicrobium sp.]
MRGCAQGARGDVQPGVMVERYEAYAGAERTLRILVVDDDGVDRLALRRALAHTGMAPEVTEADAVLAAIGLLTAEAFDCVFLDYNLPDGDGLTFLRGLRAAGIEIPVVMLTGQQDDRVAAQLGESGAVDYVDKAELTSARMVESLRRALPGRLAQPTPRTA